MERFVSPRLDWMVSEQQNVRFIRQDEIEKMKYIKKLKIYKHKELKPKRGGYGQDTQTHAGCLPQENIRI